MTNQADNLPEIEEWARSLTAILLADRRLHRWDVRDAVQFLATRTFGAGIRSMSVRERSPEQLREKARQSTSPYRTVLAAYAGIEAALEAHEKGRADVDT